MFIMALGKIWEEDSVKCVKCGARNPPGAVYCIKCGSKLVVERSMDVSSILLSLLLVMSITSIVDLLFNRGVSSLVQANPFFRALFVLGLLANIFVIYIWYRYRESGFPREGSMYRIFIASLIIILAVYITYYATFFLANVVTISPLWIFYIWIINKVLRKP